MVSLVPEVFRRPLFWMGAGVSALIVGWNLLCNTNVFPGLESIDLQGKWTVYIADGPLEALIPEGRSTVFFIILGLAFLIPHGLG